MEKQKNYEFNYFSIDDQDLNSVQEIMITFENGSLKKQKIHCILKKYFKHKNLNMRIKKYDKITIKLYDYILLKLEITKLQINVNDNSKYLLKCPYLKILTLYSSKNKICLKNTTNKITNINIFVSCMLPICSLNYMTNSVESLFSNVSNVKIILPNSIKYLSMAQKKMPYNLKYIVGIKKYLKQLIIVKKSFKCCRNK